MSNTKELEISIAIVLKRSNRYSLDDIMYC